MRGRATKYSYKSFIEMGCIYSSLWFVFIVSSGVVVARVPIPDDVAAKALFFSDRICCVCRTAKKPLQIHHIDEDSSNNALENLAVLCLDCHTETQIRGGFGRKLDAAQVRLYRDEWLEKIGRYTYEPKSVVTENDSASVVAITVNGSGGTQRGKRIETSVKRMEEESRLFSLVVEYNLAGQTELRDKVIRKILLDKDVPIGEELYLRSLQGTVHLVDPQKLENGLNEMKEAKTWPQLARAYRHVGRYGESVEYYCMTCIDSLKVENPFTAGFYLQEMIDKKLVVYLFERALEQAKQKDDVWWQIRSLQELGREDEIDDLVLKNKKLIERSGRPDELDYLRAAEAREAKPQSTRSNKSK